MVRLRSESDGEKKILPIFYDVQASDVELRTSLYDEDLLELAERFDSHDLGQWRNALIEAAKTKGYAWDGNPESLGRLVKLVVEEVLRRLRENRVSDVINLLDVGGDGVNFLGIWGMGGSGKTALATAVFNELYSRFEGRSFIRDIWEHSRRAGLVTCQAKLLSDVIQSEPPSFNSIDGGRMFIRQRLANKKVLLVLDDIDDREQLEALAGARDWFGRGSRIIITTRDRGVLDRDYPIPTYEMGFLNQYELNQRVNKFIRKFNNDLRLQREESDQRHIEMRMEKMEDEAGRRPDDMETSDRNYAIAAVRNIVGIDGRAKQITDLLEMEVNDEVRILGIFGTDGIGKTTLAKAVYDRISSCFDGRSFLSEVEETTQDPSGIQVLQTRLIRDILERDREDPSFDERIEDFLDAFHERKVLIVVDDVEEQSHLREIVGDQLHWFGPGSRIIVTSQNEEILKEYDLEKARTYTVGALDDGQAFELFCKHALGIQSSRPDYDGLANRIVNAMGKQPLAVEVVGSFLRGKSIQEWAKMEESMKACAMSSQKATVGLEETMDICYKGLDQLQKHIFLDIACFIPGVDARIASYMWPNSHLLSSGCILMPLAKIGENNELQMHRLPRRFGKRILNQEESQDPRSRRFCTQDMVLKAINRETGTGNVKALCFDFTAGDFQSMPNIRFLKLDNARVSGNFAGAFASLRWLCWQSCPPEFDAENLVLSELAILELPRGKITEDWGGWRKVKMPKLKVLNLTGCSDLLFTPDFTGYKDLEILILEGCSCLVKLDPSIGHLKLLVSLNLKSCSQLNSLPAEMGGMTALKELFVDRTSVRKIPISIGNLKKLEILSGFQCFPLTQLPRTICYLTALSELSFDGAEITELPSSLGDRLKLRRLSLRNCRYLKELPDSIGNMGSSLEELDISATNISELPGSIGNLESLKVLRMDSSFIRAFPGEIGNLTNLEELHASWCQSLKGTVPRDIKRLHHLRSLTLGHSSISSLPSEISTLSSLHTLDLLQCNEIEVLPQLPSSLIRLHMSSTRMKAIPILKDLKELEELCLSDEDPKERRPPSEQPMLESNVQHPLYIWFSRLWNLEFLQTKRIDKQSFLISFPKLRKLELSLSQIIKLKFEPADIPQLRTLTLSGLSLKEVSELPRTLSVFELYHSAIEQIEGLEGLEALRRLDISNCSIQNLSGIGQLTSLTSLIISDCDDLSLPDLSNLQSLKVLEIRRCKMIHQIAGIEKLISLQKLNISECPAENSVQVQHALMRVMACSTVE